jgi:hypothetical protein
MLPGWKSTWTIVARPPGEAGELVKVVVGRVQ